jgi:hypothetical protein
MAQLSENIIQLCYFGNMSGILGAETLCLKEEEGIQQGIKETDIYRSRPTAEAGSKKVSK